MGSGVTDGVTLGEGRGVDFDFSSSSSELFGELFFGDAEGFGELFAGECFFLGVGLGFDFDLDFFRFAVLCFFGVGDFSSSFAFLASESSSFDFGVCSGSGVFAGVALAFFLVFGFGFALGDFSGVDVGDGDVRVSSSALREVALFFSSSVNSARTSVVSMPPAKRARTIQIPHRAAAARWGSGRNRSFTPAAAQPRARFLRVRAHDAELRLVCRPEAARNR